MTSKPSRLPILYTDDGVDSQMAKDLLEAHGLKYVERYNQKIDEGEPPILISGEGDFGGINGIKLYIEFMCDLDLPL